MILNIIFLNQKNQSVNLIFGKKLLYNSKYFFMQKTIHKKIQKGDVWLKKIGHLDQNEIARIQLEYVKYVTD